LASARRAYVSRRAGGHPPATSGGNPSVIPAEKPGTAEPTRPRNAAGRQAGRTGRVAAAEPRGRQVIQTIAETRTHPATSNGRCSSIVVRTKPENQAGVAGRENRQAAAAGSSRQVTRRQAAAQNHPKSS